MKDFFLLREELQQLNESVMTDALNDLQDFWSSDAEHNIDIGVYPMFSRPFDRLVKGGVLMLGINPGNTKFSQPQRKELYNIFKGEQPPVWNAEKRRWRQIDIGRGLTKKKDDEGKKLRGSRGEKELRHSQIAVLDDGIGEFVKRGGDPNSPYVNDMRKFFKVIGRPDLATGKQLMMANIVPFASTEDKQLQQMNNKKEMMRLCKIWVDSLIKETKPKAIITLGTKPWDQVVAREVPSKSVNAISSKGLTKNAAGTSLGKILRVGYTKNGTVVLGFMHPSGSQTGGIGTKNYTQKGRVKLMKNILDEYLPK